MARRYCDQKKGNKLKRGKKHGFLKRMRTAGGAKVLQARRAKGRYSLSVQKNFYGKKR